MESDKVVEIDDEDASEEDEEDDLEQVVETQTQKWKRASTCHFDASTHDATKD